MTTLALCVTEDNWPVALDAVAESDCIGGVVAPVSLLMNSAPFYTGVTNMGLEIPHALRPMGGDAERYLFENDPPRRNRILSQWVRVLSPLGAMGVRSVALDLGLDRIGDHDVDAAIALRIDTLKHILSCLEEPLTLTIRVRCPRDFPKSRAWERAAGIVHGVMDPACRLQLDVFPAEVQRWSEWQEFERAFYLYAAVLAVHLDPLADGRLAESGALDLCASLHRRGFRGLNAFCLDGDGAGAGAFQSLCADVRQSFSQPTL